MRRLKYTIIGCLVGVGIGVCAGVWVNSTDKVYARGKLDKRRSDIVRVAQTIAPAVVNIKAKRTIRIPSPFFRFHDEFFDRFFYDFFDFLPEEEYEHTTLGSGIIISKKGYILTNEHVIRDADKIEVTLANGKKFEGKIEGFDANRDIAIIKIKGRNLPVAPLGNSRNLLIGEWVVAIGNPFGLHHTVTVGVVSATERSLGVRGWGRMYKGLIQTDASINPGNSGGPLVNMEGEVIGINTAIMSEAQGIGFAVPIDSAKDVIKRFSRYDRMEL
jgi:S1-C subfamily serine protease